MPIAFRVLAHRAVNIGSAGGSDKDGGPSTTYCVSGTMLAALYTPAHLSSITILSGRSQPYSIDARTQFREGKDLSKGLTTS